MIHPEDTVSRIDPISVRSIVSTIDLSKHPLRMQLSLIKTRDAEISLEDRMKWTMEGRAQPFCFKLIADVKDRDTSEWRRLYSYLPCNFTKNIEDQALAFVLWFVEHETCELVTKDNVRIHDPHLLPIQRNSDGSYLIRAAGTCHDNNETSSAVEDLVKGRQ